jgi:hypothetical protein
MRATKNTLSIFALLAVASALAIPVVAACGSSDDASVANDASTSGNDASNNEQPDANSSHTDSGFEGDACAIETFGESCSPYDDAGCGCGGVCAERKCVAPSKCDEALLTWYGPTENVDGTCITNLAGFTLNWWLDDGGVPSDNEVDAGFPCVAGNTFACGDAGQTVVQAECSYRIDKLANGTWDFSASSYNDAGVESTPSVTAQATVDCDGGT